MGKDWALLTRLPLREAKILCGHHFL